MVLWLCLLSRFYSPVARVLSLMKLIYVWFVLCLGGVVAAYIDSTNQTELRFEQSPHVEVIKAATSVVREEIKKERYWANTWRDNYEQLSKMKCSEMNSFIELLKESEQTYKKLWEKGCILRTSHICAGKAGGITFTGIGNGPDCTKKSGTWDIVWVDRSARDKEGKPLVLCVGQARRPKVWVEK